MKASTLKTTRSDMKTLVKDAQELFREATSSTGERAEELRARGLKPARKSRSKPMTTCMKTHGAQ